MTDRIAKLLAMVQAGMPKALRRDVKWDLAEKMAAQTPPASPLQRVSTALSAMLKAEQPVILPDERIVFTRTVSQLPELYTEEEWKQMRAQHDFAEKGVVFNLCCDFATTIAVGLEARRDEARKRSITATAPRQQEFLTAVISAINGVLELAERYRKQALLESREDIAAVLAKVPRKGATTFREALQFFRILHFTLWCEGEYHNGIGRFDQYMMPYLQHDLDAGIETPESAFELLEEFFLTFHRDSDLYTGVQQGDNGQSLVLGGCDANGKDAVNMLTRMCLEASADLKVIEPKLNLRASVNTTRELLKIGCELTAKGLGFPQYCNDDVVIPALVRWGYSLEDARNYVVAACWEFTIPGCGMDVPNIDAVSLPEVLLDCMRTTKAKDFEEFLHDYGALLRTRAEAIAARHMSFTMLPGPFASLLCDGCVKRAADISEGGRYNNFGVHGTGITVAIDSLAAIKYAVFKTKLLTMGDFNQILDDNFKTAPQLLAIVRSREMKFADLMPREGPDSGEELMKRVLELWAAAWDGLKTPRGGIWRPGTGTAMYFIYHSRNLGATPDGRLAGEPFPANFSPSLEIQHLGPISSITSFTCTDLKPVCNGGPLTLELAESSFQSPEAISHLAALVHFFLKRGGHQLQLNSVNRDTLIAAQREPEKYRNLIVRVWGWSGYFVELDKVFQDQIIKRAEMKF